jgi:hypothetical protein
MVRDGKHFEGRRRDSINEVIGKPGDHQPPHAMPGFPKLRILKQAIEHRPHGVTKRRAKARACRLIVER